MGAVQGAFSFRNPTISPGCTPIQGADSDVPENRRSDPDAVSFERQVRPSCITGACIRSAGWDADRWVSPFLLYHSAFTRCATQTKWRKSGQTQSEFVALLLFDGSPLVLTLRKLLELFGFTERSHQLLPIYGCPPLGTPQGEHREVNSLGKLGKFSIIRLAC